MFGNKADQGLADTWLICLGIDSKAPEAGSTFGVIEGIDVIHASRRSDDLARGAVLGNGIGQHGRIALRPDSGWIVRDHVAFCIKVARCHCIALA